MLGYLSSLFPYSGEPSDVWESKSRWGGVSRHRKLQMSIFNMATGGRCRCHRPDPHLQLDTYTNLRINLQSTIKTCCPFCSNQVPRTEPLLPLEIKVTPVLMTACFLAWCVRATSCSTWWNVMGQKRDLGTQQRTFLITHWSKSFTKKLITPFEADFRSCSVRDSVTSVRVISPSWHPRALSREF